MDDFTREQNVSSPSRFSIHRQVWNEKEELQIKMKWAIFFFLFSAVILIRIEFHIYLGIYTYIECRQTMRFEPCSCSPHISIFTNFTYSDEKKNNATQFGIPQCLMPVCSLYKINEYRFIDFFFFFFFSLFTAIIFGIGYTWYSVLSLYFQFKNEDEANTGVQMAYVDEAPSQLPPYNILTIEK